ncbi:hypothetical protein A2U01_0081756, partial [Trifolium medium]|nr:hypothetical protein [Trifolium medium]
AGGSARGAIRAFGLLDAAGCCAQRRVFGAGRAHGPGQAGSLLILLEN